MTAIQATIVMIFGGAIAVAGILLLFYVKSESATRITIAGFQVELTAPALVVFLGGCALIIAPALLPTTEPPDSEFDGANGANGGVSSAPAKSRAAEVCTNGDRYVVEVRDATFVEGIVTVLIRWTNDGEEPVVRVGSSMQATGSDNSGQQLEAAGGRWTPPWQLDPGAHYEGAIEFQAASEHMPAWIRIRVPGANGACQALTLQTAL
jgi:hypothetical protein